MNQQNSRNWHEDTGWSTGCKQWQKKCKSLHSEPLAPFPSLALIALDVGLFPITSSTSDSSGRLPSRESDQPQRRNFRHFNLRGLPKRGWDPIQLLFRKCHQNTPQPFRASNQCLSKWSHAFSPFIYYSRTLLTNLHLTDQYSPSLRKTYWQMFMVYCTLMASRLLSGIITYFHSHKLSYFIVFLSPNCSLPLVLVILNI